MKKKNIKNKDFKRNLFSAKILILNYRQKNSQTSEILINNYKQINTIRLK